MRLNELVDCIYVINLEKSKDRLEKFQEQAKKYDIEFTRVIPVDSTQFSITPIEENGWNNNAKSLKVTTQGIIKEAKSKGCKNILIFEDDAKINDTHYNNFLSDLKHFLDFAKVFDFIHIFHSHGVEFSLSSYYNFRLTKDGVFGCLAYIVNESVFDIYLQQLERHEAPIDHITKRIQFHRRRSFLYMKNVVIHEKNKWSTLRERIVDY